MKLSEFKGEDALDVFAEILDPAIEIMADTDIKDAYLSGNKILAIKRAIKKHKKSVIYILAILNGKDPQKYEPNVLSLPLKILEILNDKELMEVFTLQGQRIVEESSGSAMENTEAKEH